MLSHSLPAVAVLAAAFALLYYAVARDFAASVIVIGWAIYRRSLPGERRRSSPVMVLLFCLLLLQLAASVSFSLFPGVKKC